MILITGAGGKTGRAVLRALIPFNEPVRALVHREKYIQEMGSLGAAEVVTGDMLDPASLQSAFQGIRAVYHICPNMSPDEIRIAENALAAARTAGVELFAYHSVLHPQVEAMPHHWAKMRVEELLFTSGLPFIVLQPGPYMQNVLAYWDDITRRNVYPVPYAVTARLSVVDLDDLAETAAMLLHLPLYSQGIYELAGPEPLSQIEVAQILSEALDQPVRASAVDRVEWEQNARARGMPAYTISGLIKMFEYYERYGLEGNSQVLSCLLGRPARTFREFIHRQLS